MRALILSDIHSNLTALEAVLADAQQRGPYHDIWVLGDTVGYGPDPSACIGILRRAQAVCVAGNHDLAAVGKIPLGDFNPYAAEACRWTTGQLRKVETDYLTDLPLTVERGEFTLAHGSPRDPVWEYLTSPEEAQESFKHFSTRYCLVGHTHIPLLFVDDGQTGKCSMYRLGDGATIELRNERLIFNPGGVGQPRDRDPRAAYAIYDSEANAITHHRVEYDISATQERMRRASLPAPLINRLSQGW